MTSSDKARFHPDLSKERRRFARPEDRETESMIRKYMRLADTALENHSDYDDAVPGNRMRRYFELAEICLQGKWRKTG